MMIPGANLLQIALGVIQPTSGVTLEVYLKERDNDFGGTVVEYEPPIPWPMVSVQPVTKEQAQINGLAVNKDYITIWVTKDLTGAYRGKQNDRVTWSGHQWAIMPEQDWMFQDGWVQVLAVRL